MDLLAYGAMAERWRVVYSLHMNSGVSKARPFIREPFCGISHLIGAVISVAGLVVLLVLADGRPLCAVSFALYGASLIALYTSSTLYHSLHVGSDLLQKIDHCAIYCLIAGTYVPISLVGLGGPWGWVLFGLETAMAVFGVMITLLYQRQPAWVRVVLYIVMGWLALVAFGPLRAALPPAAIRGLVLGGLLYTTGAIVFATDRPHLWPNRFSAHDLWHVFVLAGSAAHFWVILEYLALGRS